MRHHTDINISTGTVPLTAWGSGNVNHHLLPLQGANGFTWYFERDDVVIYALLVGNLTRVNSGVMEEHNRITIDHIDLYWCIDSICTKQKGLKFQNCPSAEYPIEFLNLKALTTLPVIQPPNSQVYIDSMLRRRELDEDLKWLDRFFGNGCQGVHNIVGVQWFHDESGLLYSHQKLYS